MRHPRKEQFSGSLIGQCLGDALGFIVEGHPHEFCLNYIEKVVKSGQIEQMHRGHYCFGQYSDDSQLARELIRSYVSCRTLDPADYARRIAHIFAESKIVGYGRATLEAAQRLQRGMSWDKAGTPPPSAGNGSAMRAGPVGLMFFDDPENLIHAACDQGRITHSDTRCSGGALAIAGAVALALTQEHLDINSFLSQLTTWTRRVDESIAQGIHHLEQWRTLPPQQVVRTLIDNGFAPGYYQGLSPFVTGSVLWSLYSFLTTPNDYRETVYTAIAVGGDVDTTAAMAGAISGAYLGLEALPSELTSYLTDQGTWNYDDLVELAHTCYDIKMQNMRT
jgi:ADP-ribosylglycohydrolase